MSDNRSWLLNDRPPERQRAPSPSEDRLFNALLTEHFVLQTARATTVSEASTRASLYLVTLSSALVAYGFLAGTSHETAFLAIVLPVLLLLGLSSYARLVETSLEDVLALAGIQRIRRYYATLHPDAPRYFPIPTTRSAPNELLETGRHAGWWGVFFTMSTSIAVVNSVVAGTALFVLLTKAPAPSTATITLAIGVAVLVGLGQLLYQEARYRTVGRGIAANESRTSPTPSFK